MPYEIPPAAEDHNITCLLYVLGTWLKFVLILQLKFVLNLHCFWTLPECSVLVRCSGSPVVDFLYGSLVTVGLGLSSEGFEPQCITCWIWRVSITGCPALSKAHPEF